MRACVQPAGAAPGAAAGGGAAHAMAGRVSAGRLLRHRAQRPAHAVADGESLVVLAAPAADDADQPVAIEALRRLRLGIYGGGPVPGDCAGALHPDPSEAGLPLPDISDDR